MTEQDELTALKKKLEVLRTTWLEIAQLNYWLVEIASEMQTHMAKPEIRKLLGEEWHESN